MQRCTIRLSLTAVKHSEARASLLPSVAARIIPIYLVHRPSNEIPYATLEEELIGDFVKYSVKDGKEINLMRRDSEAGQKCCAFQHWVYHKTEGNLLVTDMQGAPNTHTELECVENAVLSSPQAEIQESVFLFSRSGNETYRRGNSYN